MRVCLSQYVHVMFKFQLLFVHIIYTIQYCHCREQIIGFLFIHTRFIMRIFTGIQSLL